MPRIDCFVDETLVNVRQNYKLVVIFSFIIKDVGKCYLTIINKNIL